MTVAAFAEYCPDLPPLGRTTDHVQNVVATSKGIYAPIKAPVPTGDALTARCQGAATFVGSDGTVVTFAGDATKLYLWDGDGWDDVSQAMTTYATASDGRWVFSQADNDKVIADNGVDAPQVWEIGTSTEWADLGGSPAVARYNATVRDFSFRAALSTDLTGVAWSSQFNCEEWTEGTNQSDTQSLPAGGRITGLVGGQFALIFQQAHITLAQYVGPDLIFQFDQVSIGRGCSVPGSIATTGLTTFFLFDDGFYRIDNGQTVTPIGDGKVDAYFWATVNRSYLYRVWSAVARMGDGVKVYVITFPSSASADGTPDTTLIYNYTAGWWARGNFGGDALALLLTERSMTLEGLDTEYPSGLDSIPLSLDSDLFLATGLARLGMFDTDFKVNFFDGENLAAEIDTVETHNIGMRQSEVDRLRAMIVGGDDTTVISAQLGYRNRQNDGLTFSAEVAQDDLGVIYFTEPPAWYQRARVKISGAWEKAQGVEFVAVDGGDG